MSALAGVLSQATKSMGTARPSLSCASSRIRPSESEHPGIAHRILGQAEVAMCADFLGQAVFSAHGDIPGGGTASRLATCRLVPNLNKTGPLVAGLSTRRIWGSGGIVKAHDLPRRLLVRPRSSRAAGTRTRRWPTARLFSFGESSWTAFTSLHGAPPG